MKSDTVPSQEEMLEALREIAGKVAEDLKLGAHALLLRLTADEVKAFTRDIAGSGYYKYRLAKALIVALAEDGRITRQWSAEGIRPVIRKLKHISTHRP